MVYDVGGEGIARITLRREHVLNAINPEMMRALRAAINEFHADDSARVAVISGAGRAFCAGADLREIPTAGPPEPTGDLGRMSEMVLSQEIQKPMIAAVHGHAVGAGLRLALLCDFLLCTESAQFRAPEVSHGLNSGSFWWMLQARAGDSFATEVVATGRAFSGTEAAARGVAIRAVHETELHAQADILAGRIAEQPRASMSALVDTRRSALRQFELNAWTSRGRGLMWGRADEKSSS
ncbi:enoyl-CoA hydratase/isomerase family protein [Arthrobacter sp. FW306-2-2C-D06B]|nr:enoyl-CoA hydratase/isomerase family protein [Arthrobacter sp. FW306-2-2C-D06B]